MKTPKTMKKDEIAQIKTKKWHWAWSWGLGILVIITLGIVFAEPVEDGDLWWQMAYGRYMIENRTLIPDHTVFTWSLTDGSLIYCAWIAEISLYLLHKTGGLPLLFAFRYLCLIIFVLIIFFYARKLGVANHPLTWLIILLGLLMSQAGAYLKPEIFSYVFMTLVVGTWFLIKSTEEKKAGRYCYIFPILMVVWVNSHGGFIFGLAFLAIMGVGEGLNICFSKDIALSPGVRRHFMIALILSFFSIFITPYGWKYPVQLADNLLGQSVRELQTVHAYLSIFHPEKRHLHFVNFFCLGIFTLILLFLPAFKKRRFDFALILTNLAFGVLYTRFLRTTYFWAPIFALSALYLVSSPPARLWPQKRTFSLATGGVIVILCIFLSGRAGFASIYKPNWPSYFGFGNSYYNPEEETEFIKKYLSGYRLGNLYTSGGYLLWKLWPDTKVMIDPRYFPFKKWYIKYYNFALGYDIEEFLEEFPTDVWYSEHEFKKSLSWFLRSPDWKVVFYGPSGVVFAKKWIELPGGLSYAGKGMGEIRNLSQVLLALNFIMTINDWDTARDILAGMEKRFKLPDQRRRVESASNFIKGKIAYLNLDYKEAVKYLKACHSSEEITWNNVYLINSYTQLARIAWAEKEDQGALERSRAALAHGPENIYALFNMGVIEWYLDKQNEEEGLKTSSSATDIFRSSFQPDRKWRQRLETFVEKGRQIRRFPENVMTIAKGILQGTYDKRPPLIYPPERPLPAVKVGGTSSATKSRSHKGLK